MRLTETESKSGEAGDEGGERGGEREVDDGGMRAAKEESEGVMERGGDTCEGGESVETGGKHYRT